MPEIPPPLPPQPLQTLNYAPPPQRTDLRTIAIRQKVVIFCILGYLLLVVLQFVVPPELRRILLLLAVAVIITGAVFVFMLSLALYDVAAGIVLGILTLIPLIGLIVLLIINGKATNVLKENGIHVGLLGATASQIPAPGQVPMR